MNKKYLIGICVIIIVLLFIIINVIIFNDKDVKSVGYMINSFYALKFINDWSDK